MSDRESRQEAAITIRRATLDDLPTVVEFNHRMAWETERLDLDREVLTAGVKSALADPGRALYFVAESAGMVVGQVMVTFEWSDWRNGDAWWLQSVYVAPDYRKRGVFGALFQRVLEEGRKAGAAAFRLYVEGENRAAQEAYRRLGMVPSVYQMWEYQLSTTGE